MGESRVKSENYVSVQGFMVKDLKLKGNELIVYAIIYGFSQTDNQVFTGSLQYLADWTNSTKQGVTKNLKSLVEKGYIQKNDKYINGVKFCEYYATELYRVLNKVDGGMQQSCIGGIQQSLTNNIVNNNIEDNIDNNKEEYFSNKELNDIFLEFIEVRKKLKAVNSERAIKTLINTLNNYDDATKYKMIENSIVNSWKSIYPLKENASNKYTRQEIVPEWFNKDAKEQKTTDKEQEELNNILSGYDKEDDFETRRKALQERLKEKYKKDK